MRVRFAIVFAVSLASVCGAGAQTAPPSTGGRVLTPAQQANRDRVNGEKDTCRAQAKAQGLRGPAVRTAMIDCMSKTDPAAARRMTCFGEAHAKGLKGDEARASVRECVRGAQ